MKHTVAGVSGFRRHNRFFIVLHFALVALLVLGTPVSNNESFLATRAEADSVYFNLASGSLNYSLTAATANQITSNDNWSGVGSVEAYFGQNLTATHGVDPQTILGTEFASNLLPNTPTDVSANRSNPSAFNAGGVAEFDSGAFLAIGLQGNTQANPYLVFYLNTTGRTNVTMSYTVQDIDGGANDSVSPIALQYRIGQTGLFTNVPAGYIPDVSVGGATGPAQPVTVTLPAAVNNQPQVQVRLITTNAANSSGAATADEWIGLNNFSFTSLAPTAAGVEVGGRVVTSDGYGVRGALVTAWDSMGNSKTAIAGPFGYFMFSDVEVGQTYIFEVSSKRYTFVSPTIVRTVHDNITDLEFVASPRITVTSLRRSVRD